MASKAKFIAEKIGMSMRALDVPSIPTLLDVLFPAGLRFSAEDRETLRSSLEKWSRGQATDNAQFWGRLRKELEVEPQIGKWQLMTCSTAAFLALLPFEMQRRVCAAPAVDVAKWNLGPIVPTLNEVDAQGEGNSDVAENQGPSGISHGGVATGPAAKLANIAGEVRVVETIGKAIQDSPAHFIGEFPGHLHHVIKMVREAKSSLCVMVDCVDYGSFSNPDLHEGLIRAICDSLTDKDKPAFTVKMLITGKPAPISKASPFYGRSFEKLRNEKAFQEVFDSYLLYHNEYRKKPPTNEGEFINILQKQQEKSRSRLHDAGSGAKIFDLDGKPTQKCEVVGELLEQPKKKPSPNSSDLFFWIADGNKAIFLFSNTGSGPWEIAFQTEQLELLNIFNRIFTQHWKDP